MFLNKTVSLILLGNSIPITFCPDTMATLTASTVIDLAISSARETTLWLLKPGAGCKSYLVTTGPYLTVSIFPFIE